MSQFTYVVLKQSRMFVSAVALAALMAAFLVADAGSAYGDERATPVIGSLAVGGSVTAGVDERSGKFATQTSLGALPGVGGSGGVSMDVSYSQDLAASGGDPHELGAGWSWGVSRVMVDGGVQVITPSGQTYVASNNDGGGTSGTPSGLEEYVQGDLVFSQIAGSLDPREGTTDRVAYAYSLEHLGGVTDYFSATGHIMARTDAYGYRVDWSWDGDRLVGVVDGAGSKMVINWTTAGLNVVSPPRSDGVVAETVVQITENRLVSITNPAKEDIEFGYDAAGLLARVTASSGAVTEVTYQPLPKNHLANNAQTVDQVRIVDSSTGEELSVRRWGVIGEHNPQGSPKYSNASEMWGSGDGEYQYETVVTDGDTSVLSVYNSMGLMLSRRIVVSTPSGEIPVQEQNFTYKGTEAGGVPDKDLVPEQYAKPTSTRIAYSDGGKTREVTEYSEFDKTGRVTKQTSADGSTTVTEYDTDVPENMNLPIGLVKNQTVKGHDNTISETKNTLTPDRKAISATETKVATPGGSLEPTSRTEFDLQPDGFVSEQRLVATGTVAEGPETVVTRFNRTVDKDAKTITLSRIDAVETPAESTTSTIVDVVTGLELSAVDATGRVATTHYDHAGRVVTQIAPGDLRTVTEYGDTFSRVTGPNGVSKSEYVDVLGRVVEVVDNVTTTADGTFVPHPDVKRKIETRKYEQNGSKVTVTDGRGLETVAISDLFGRPVSVTTPSQAVQLWEYDDVANEVRSGIVGPSGSGLNDALQVTTKRMDDRNRDIETTSARRDDVRVPSQTTAYDGLGRVTATSGRDMSTSVVLNPNGTPKTTTVTPTETSSFPGDPLIAERQHDLLGASTKKTLTQTNGSTREGVSRVLDGAGRTTSETDQAGRITLYQYTADGLVAEARNEASGATTRNTYDPTTRALRTTETTAADGGVSQTQYEYDPVTGTMLSVYDPADSDNTRISYAYDIFGNVTLITYPDGKTVRHVFDAFEQKISSADIEGNVTVYEYDRLGLLERATQTTADQTALGRVEYSYDEFGRMRELSRGNGVTTRYTLTAADEIATETTTRGETVVAEAAYEYDAHGNLTQRIDTRPADTDVTQPVTETTVYTYNAFDQLIESAVFSGAGEHRAAQSSLITTYEIGVSDEVLTETIVTDAKTSVREFEYDALGQMVAITTDGETARQEYDQAGNLTRAADGATYTYNVYNQPVTETRPGDDRMVESTYWSNGQRRTMSSVNGAESGSSRDTVELYWDGSTLINDAYFNESVVGSYLIGASRHTRNLVNRDSTNYYVADRHGSTTALVDHDGQTTTTYGYNDYGVVIKRVAPGLADTPAERNPFQYASEFTTVTGSQLLGVRSYDPTVFAFTTKDNADQFNLYSYANSNPITRIDPTGQTAVPDKIILGVGIGVELIGFFVAAAVMTLATFGSSLPAFITAAVAFAVDGAGAMISTHLLIDQHVEGADFISDETSEKLNRAGLGLALGGLALGLSAGLLGYMKRTAADQIPTAEQFMTQYPGKNAIKRASTISSQSTTTTNRRDSFLRDMFDDASAISHETPDLSPLVKALDARDETTISIGVSREAVPNEFPQWPPALPDRGPGMSELRAPDNFFNDPDSFGRSVFNNFGSVDQVAKTRKPVNIFGATEGEGLVSFYTERGRYFGPQGSF